MARLRVSGAMTMRFFSDWLPSWVGVNKVLFIKVSRVLDSR